MSPFKLYKTYGYFVSVILLQLFLGWLFYHAFDSPEGNLFDHVDLATYWGIVLLVVTTLIFLEAYQKSNYWLLPCAIIVGYTIFLFVLYESHIFIDIPRVKSTSINYEIIPLYLTIPGMFHALLSIIYHYFRPTGKLNENAQNFALSAMIPILIYIITMIIIPMFRTQNYGWLHLNEFAMKVGICIAITAFLFFFIRFVLGNMVGKKLGHKNSFFVVFFAFIFPLIGLVLNKEFEVFGDFDFPLIYVGLFINAIGLILLLMKSDLYKFIGFLMASFGVPIVFYFFIIFLPYVPLSFIALIVFGAGILMLTPIVLLLIQFRIMKTQFFIITKVYHQKTVISLSIFCFLLLPMSYVGFCMDHHHYLTKVITETAQFNASDRDYTEFDRKKIAYILQEMHKENRRLSFGNMERRLPLLSLFYDWYVFDNLQVSQQKTAEIRRLYLGESTSVWSGYIPPQQMNAELTYTHQTSYVAKGDYYKTQLELSITNLDSVGGREFSTNFTLPKDVFIADYYLDIEGRRTFGILAEKKAANWIYEQITSQRRDPGILQYLYGDVLSFKIYPFRENETRTSGFTLYHRTPVHFSLNNTPIAIDVKPLSGSVTELSPNTFYIPSEAKEKLPKVPSPVQYYFVVDNTTLGNEFREQFKEDFSSLPANVQQQAQVLYVDADVNWGKPTAPKASGFNYRKVMAQIQYAHRNQQTIPYVIVYAPLENRYLQKYSAQEMEKAFPYQNLIEHSHWDKKIKSSIELVAFSRNGQSCYLQNNEQPSLVSFDDAATLNHDLSGNVYLNALQLRLFHDLNDLNPKRKKEHWLQALRESFKQQILTHSTTFISLENKQQKERLLQKQKEIMEADYSEKAGTEMRRMSEPYFWVLLLFVLFIIRKQFLPQKTQR